jgi:hypothetical protein
MIRSLLALLIVGMFGVLLPAADEPPKLLKPTPLAVNTDKDEDEPHISSDNLQLFYTTVGKDKSEAYGSFRKKADQPWPKGKALPDLKTKTASVRSVFLTADGKYPQFLYFASNRDPEKKGEKGDNFDIYFLIRQRADADFTTETAVISVGTEDDELHPWLTPDGKNLYFSRKEKDGWHVYRSSRPGVGQFGEPMKLDFPPDFHHATLTPDGKAMILQGPLEGKGDKKRWGLFLSTNPKGKAWSKPEPLVTLNHPDGPTGDRSPCLSRDGEALYFASDRPGGKGGLDLYMIPTAQLAKKAK